MDGSFGVELHCTAFKASHRIASSTLKAHYSRIHPSTTVQFTRVARQQIDKLLYSNRIKLPQLSTCFLTSHHITKCLPLPSLSWVPLAHSSVSFNMTQYAVQSLTVISSLLHIHRSRCTIRGQHHRCCTHALAKPDEERQRSHVWRRHTSRFNEAPVDHWIFAIKTISFGPLGHGIFSINHGSLAFRDCGIL